MKKLSAKTILTLTLLICGLACAADNAKSDKPITFTNTTITKAVAKGDLEDIKRYIASGIDLNQQNSS